MVQSLSDFRGERLMASGTSKEEDGKLNNFIMSDWLKDTIDIFIYGGA